jgi:hypothetical protein
MLSMSFDILYLFKFLILIKGVKSDEGSKVVVHDQKHHAWNIHIKF